MSNSDPELGLTVLGKIEILSYLGEVADELAVRHLACRVVVVGGSYLALQSGTVYGPTGSTTRP